MYAKIDKANTLRPARFHLVHNHLEKIKVLCTKTGLIKALRHFYSSNIDSILSHYTIHDTTPVSYIVTTTCQDTEFIKFVKYFQELQPDRPKARNAPPSKMPPKHCSENVWLLKPAAMNQGRGIEIFKNDLAGIKKSLQSKPLGGLWVLQKYVERPLLYKGRKFDIRVWALITWKIELFYYRFGYIRTSSYEYSLDSSESSSNGKYVHLTNNCLQQFGKEYGKYEDGNTIGFHQFITYLNTHHPTINFEKDIVPRMKDIIIDTYLAAKDSINPRKRKNCFELLGYDFLIDEDFKVWLLEVNTNPYLGIPNHYIEGVMPKLLNDMLELALDPYQFPANKLPERRIPNQFELLYDDRIGLNQRREYSASIYPNLDPCGEPALDKTAILKADVPTMQCMTTTGESMIESIKTLRKTNEAAFMDSSLFFSLVKSAFNTKSDLSDFLRKYVVSILFFFTYYVYVSVTCPPP